MPFCPHFASYIFNIGKLKIGQLKKRRQPKYLFLMEFHKWVSLKVDIVSLLEIFFLPSKLPDHCVLLSFVACSFLRTFLGTFLNRSTNALFQWQSFYKFIFKESHFCKNITCTYITLAQEKGLSDEFPTLVWNSWPMFHPVTFPAKHEAFLTEERKAWITFTKTIF